ncbi:MAG: DNA primase catalytic subunit PriS [Methanobrevibacter sp.]|uniref:DNA primase catalytic subunit PriS n=1 Tax=Methanobrevibacter sp. TaxID=66852 RepID=UPI0026DFAF2D|nr:DNA primase catalytic subunit PriS [Methanobrevibacter sp.]MDO5849245.1 DNA primase catalytic subunit PriS [Methanobrevibacter sp.]
MFSKATLKERRQYYREEWSEKDLPDFISKEITKREFGFDHIGNGPNDRYKVFKGKESLRKFLRYKSPFAAYVSVAFYNNPSKRQDWQKAEFIFDVDAKDIPIRTCQCDGVCEVCLGEAKEIVNNLIDTLEDDLGLQNIHLIYSGRGYHIRILDEEVMTEGSELRGELLKYAAGAEVPNTEFSNSNLSNKSFNFEHFSIPIGYPKVFTQRVKYNIQHLVGNEQIDGINKPLMKDIIKYRHLVDEGQWGMFKNNIGPIRYKKLTKAMARTNLETIDAKVSIDLKRILRLPSSLHSKVSMKCVEVKNRETFDPFKEAVPKFVYERN